MEFHRSAGRHGIARADVEHALEHCIVVVEVDPDIDPRKLLAIGPASSGQLLEVVVLRLEKGKMLVIHAMAMRRKFRGLLPSQEHDR